MRLLNLSADIRQSSPRRPFGKLLPIDKRHIRRSSSGNGEKQFLTAREIVGREREIDMNFRMLFVELIDDLLKLIVRVAAKMDARRE